MNFIVFVGKFAYCLRMNLFIVLCMNLCIVFVCELILYVNLFIVFVCMLLHLDR